MIQTQQWDSPLARAVRPDDWWWGHPLVDWLAVITESVHNANLLMGNWGKAKKSDLLKLPRPGQKNITKLGNNPVALADMDAWMSSRMTS